MSYSSQIADLLASQPTKLVTLRRDQLAGQAANLDFWLTEVSHCLAVIDGYRDRFERMRAAQRETPQAWGALRRGSNFQESPVSLEDGKKPDLLRPVDDKELRQSRLNLCEAAYRFLIRCRNEGFVSESALGASCKVLGISVDVKDIKVGRQRELA